jgi:polyferredoxin
MSVTTVALIGGHPAHWFLEVDPLVAVVTALSTHALRHNLLWAVPLIVLTLVFGRFFCGWICPMGVMHHIIGYSVRKRRAKERMEQNRLRKSRQIKFALLAIMLGMAAAGSVQIGWLDPIATTWRAFSVALFPAADNTAFGVYQGERHFQFGLLITVFFFTALALNLVYPRLYCRMLCPLGALFGVLSRASLFRIARTPSKCTDCGLCAADCQGAAVPNGETRVTECMVCLNCTHACPHGAISYQFVPHASLTNTATDLGRRRWVGALAGGVISLPLMRASAGVVPRPDPHRIRPPGALEEKEFLARCLKCGACMKVCPTGGLQPALLEAGFEGMWTPILVPRLGCCEQNCVACGHVCPTGAIGKLKIAEKIGLPPYTEPVRIGTAAFDRSRCLPWAFDVDCIVCEEVCPTSPKAVYFKEETVTLRDGSRKTLKRPHVDPTRCTGCGTCESRCPISDRAGVRCTSVGESRSPENQLIMSGKL